MAGKQRHAFGIMVLGAGLLVLAVAWSAMAVSQAPDRCDGFSAQSDDSPRHVTFIDHASDGLSIGDQRIGYRTVIDEIEPRGTLGSASGVIEVVPDCDSRRTLV